MKSEEYFNKVQHLRWLERIEKEYRDNAEKMRKNNFETIIDSVSYTIKGGHYRIDVNPHRAIEARYIYGGLTDALERIAKEIEDLRKELKTVIVQL